MTNTKLIKCRRCRGTRKVRGAGMIDKTCDKCKGVGYEELEPEKPIDKKVVEVSEDVKHEQSPPARKKAGRPKKK
jgi:hypothetical protein